jgi:hypothetical protein
VKIAAAQKARWARSGQGKIEAIPTTPMGNKQKMTDARSSPIFDVMAITVRLMFR